MRTGTSQGPLLSGCSTLVSAGAVYLNYKYVPRLCVSIALGHRNEHYHTMGTHNETISIHHIANYVKLTFTNCPCDICNVGNGTSPVSHDGCLMCDDACRITKGCEQKIERGYRGYSLLNDTNTNAQSHEASFFRRQRAVKLRIASSPDVQAKIHAVSTVQKAQDGLASALTSLLPAAKILLNS